MYERVWDEADYVVPPAENGAFFVTTNVVITPNQTRGHCPEVSTTVLLELFLLGSAKLFYCEREPNLPTYFKWFGYCCNLLQIKPIIHHTNTTNMLLSLSLK